MAFNAAGLKVIANGGALGTGDGSVAKIYHYVSNDTLAAVVTDAYFDTVASDPLVAGDIIVCSLDMDGTILPGLLIVTVGGADVTVVAIPIA